MRDFQEIYLDKWEDYVDLFSDYNFENKEFIFRGHSNSISDEKKFNTWEIISSFNRSKRKLESYSFHSYLSQHLDSELFRIYYENYAFEKARELTKASILDKCYFFQHYGIPTCFIDFTFDPLIALYFSITGLDGRSGGQFDLNGNPLFYSNEKDRDYVTIYKIDVKRLQQLFKIKDITNENFNIFELDSFQVSPITHKDMSAYLALDLAPISISSGLIDNFNLRVQKGCFLYFDNEDINMSLETFLSFYSTVDHLTNWKNIITIYRINYNSLYKPRISIQRTGIPLFRYLQDKKVTGQYLFNDIQGLKYDFNFFHQQ